MKYESSIFNGLKVMAKVKVFVYTNANVDTDTRAVTLAPRTFVPACLKLAHKCLIAAP